MEDGARRAGPGPVRPPHPVRRLRLHGAPGAAGSSCWSSASRRSRWSSTSSSRCGGSPATASARSARSRQAQAQAEQAGGRAVRAPAAGRRRRARIGARAASAPGPRSRRSPPTSRTRRPSPRPASAEPGRRWSPSRRPNDGGASRQPDPVRPAAAQHRRRERVDLDTVTMRYWFTADGADHAGGRLLLRDLRLRQARARRRRPARPARGRRPLPRGRLHRAGSSTPGAVGDARPARDPRPRRRRRYDQQRRLQLPQPEQLHRQPARHGVRRRASWSGAPSPTPLPVVESVEVQYANRDRRPAGQRDRARPSSSSTPGPSTLDLRRVTIRYWFTQDGDTQSLLGVLRLRRDRLRQGQPELRAGVAGPAERRHLPRGRVHRRDHRGRRQRPGRSSCASTRPTTRTSTRRDDYSRGTNTAFELNHDDHRVPRRRARLGDASRDRAARRPERAATGCAGCGGTRCGGCWRSCCCWSRPSVGRELDARPVQRQRRRTRRTSVSAGSMTQVNSADNAAIMGATDLVPGEQVSGVGDHPERRGRPRRLHV